jgi:hypothetical protein
MSDPFTLVACRIVPKSTHLSKCLSVHPWYQLPVLFNRSSECAMQFESQQYKVLHSPTHHLNVLWLLLPRAHPTLWLLWAQSCCLHQTETIKVVLCRGRKSNRYSMENWDQLGKIGYDAGPELWLLEACWRQTWRRCTIRTCVLCVYIAGQRPVELHGAEQQASTKPILQDCRMKQNQRAPVRSTCFSIQIATKPKNTCQTCMFQQPDRNKTIRHPSGIHLNSSTSNTYKQGHTSTVQHDQLSWRQIQGTATVSSH